MTARFAVQGETVYENTLPLNVKTWLPINLPQHMVIVLYITNMNGNNKRPFDETPAFPNFTLCQIQGQLLHNRFTGLCVLNRLDWCLWYILVFGQNISIWASTMPHYQMGFQGIDMEYTYRIIVFFSRVKTNSKLVLCVIDVNSLNYDQVPHEAEDEKMLCCLCCADGPVSLKARIERSSYALGNMSNTVQAVYTCIYNVYESKIITKFK